MWQGTIIWDDPADEDGNIAHIDLHDITPDEVLDVLLAREQPDELSESTGLPIVFGFASTGKYLAVVYEDFGNARRPDIVEAFHATRLSSLSLGVFCTSSSASVMPA